MELKTGRSWDQARADVDPQLTFQAMAFRAGHSRPPKRIVVEKLSGMVAPKRFKMETRRVRMDYETEIQRAMVAIDGINKGVFLPAAVGAWWCSAKWCGFWESCDYARRS